ncbi:MAG TPA: sterol desaturase family protein [Flavitalea sp.]|nr:sterol desaturase family protein [Flavitalea sp.]
MYPLPDLNNPYWFLICTLLFFIVVVGRYLLIAALFYAIFYIWFREKWSSRKLNAKNYKPGQFKREVAWSTLTALIFSVAGAITVLLWQKGLTKIYLIPDQYGWWYLPFSLFVILVLHETYYYWVHRVMHHPKIFRIVHKVHHDSNITSPFTAFSFHPIEGLLQAIILPVLLLVIPLHPAVILTILTIMTLSSVINHLDIEIYPEKFHRHAIGRWLIGATHHSLHHKQFKYNYGLYFTFWDKVKGTESPLYKSLFEEKTKKPRADTL